MISASEIDSAKGWIYDDKNHYTQNSKKKVIGAVWKNVESKSQKTIW